MGRKSRTDLIISAEMAAEDAYRYKLGKDNNIPPEKMCYWFKYTKSGNIPGGKETDNKYKTRYYAHMTLLKEAFDKDTSLFQLKKTGDMGLGVFARNDLEKIGGNSGTITINLQATYYHVIENVVWSNGIVTTYNNPEGRPKFAERKSSSRIRDMMMVGDDERSLVGPFNFLNHACDDHSQFEWEEEVSDKTIHAFPKKNLKIRKGEQIFINYQNGMDGAEVDYKCPFC